MTMKRLSSLPCDKWADQLIAGHADTLPLSEYLVLKEHLLTCPACSEAHNYYLSIQAQIRSLPMLQPQRQCAAAQLAQDNYRSALPSTHRLRSLPIPNIAALKMSTIFLLPFSPLWLRYLAAQMRKPVYAFMTLLFCLLATVVSAGTMSSSLHTTTMSTTPSPRLAVSTTGLALHAAMAPLVNAQVSPHSSAQWVLFTGTIMLSNTGDHSLIWQVDTSKSVTFYVGSIVRLQANPSHGTLGHNKHSFVQVIADGITRDSLPLKQDIELGSIFFTSNGGEAAIHTMVKRTETSEQVNSPLSQPLKTNVLTDLSLLPIYVFRRQYF